MSSSALEAQGTKLSIGNGATPTEVFTAIKEIKSFNGPGGSASIIDVSDLDSTAREKRMGLADEGQLQFTINYIPKDAQHTLLRTHRANRTKANFKLTFTDSPTPTVWSFSGYVTAFSVGGSVDGVIEGNVTIEITGSITAGTT